MRERARFHLKSKMNKIGLNLKFVEQLHQTFPGLEKLFSSRYSIIALNIAERFTHPDMVRNMDIDTLISYIFNST